jgi:hypothetical protein
MANKHLVTWAIGCSLHCTRASNSSSCCCCCQQRTYRRMPHSLLCHKACANSRSSSSPCCAPGSGMTLSSTGGASAGPGQAVVAETTLTCCVMTRTDFERLLGPYEELWRYEALRKVCRDHVSLPLACTYQSCTLHIHRAVCPAVYVGCKLVGLRPCSVNCC